MDRTVLIIGALLECTRTYKGTVWFDCTRRCRWSTSAFYLHA